MGGSSSGRYRQRNRGTVEAAIRLDLRKMRRQGFLVPGAVTSGVQRWHWVATGQETGSVNVSVNLSDPVSGSVTVRFNLNGEPKVQTIDLVSVPMRYGGRRYYFVCPKHGRQCEVLPMVGGVFASRQALRLTYQSQSSDRVDRLRERARRLEKRIWPDKGKARPRGRNRERLVEAWGRADRAFEDLFAATIMRRWGHLL
jgi:hypothetical protein